MLNSLNLIKNVTKNLIIILLSFLISLIFVEIILRIKHNLRPNYDIEMWKYAKQLKVKSKNPKINHTHKKNKTAILQNVEISINDYGQRDKNFKNFELKNYERSFLILGSSITLGWGVEKKNNFSSLLNSLSEKKSKNWIFVNGGVGNYNTERYVNNYFDNWEELEFTDVIVHFFVNDTELLDNNQINFFTKHTHVGVITWKLLNSFSAKLRKENLVNYYKEKYEDNYLGFINAKNEIIRLDKHCDEININCHLIIMPDIHQLNPYKLNFINKKMLEFSNQINLDYLDLTPSFQGINEKKIWNDFLDPHPNSKGHKIIAENIFSYLNK